MTRILPYPKAFVTSILLGVAACRPDAPATHEKPAAGPAPDPATSPSIGLAAATTDTLHLPGGKVVSLRSSTAVAFDRLPASPLPDLPNDPAAEPRASAPGRVRRQGLDLFLATARGGEVRLSSTPDSAFTLQNGEGVKYMYWGSLPATHQWVVRAWAWEAAGTVLVDQRTGHRLAELPGDPVAAPDGRLLLLTSPGLGGGDQLNALSLVQVTGTGARLLWQREPTAWEPVEARWAAPNRAILKLRHLNAQGELPDDAPVSYAELVLPQ
jgi:hypothetical protein